MKRSNDFLLQNVAGTIVVVPVGEAISQFPGMMRLNETGAFLWDLLEQEQTVSSMVDALMEHYDVDEVTARGDVEAFVDKLLPTGAIV